MHLKFYYPIFKKSCHFPLLVDPPVQSPSVPGVYFITEFFMGEEVIVYIGSSGWLRSRLVSHPIINKLKKEGCFGNVYVIPLWKDEYKYMEKYYIKKMKPKYNKLIYKN